MPEKETKEKEETITRKELEIIKNKAEKYDKLIKEQEQEQEKPEITVTDAQELEIEQAEPEPKPKQDPNKNYCANCGAELTDKPDKCPNCQAVLEWSAE